MCEVSCWVTKIVLTGPAENSSENAKFCPCNEKTNLQIVKSAHDYVAGSLIPIAF